MPLGDRFRPRPGYPDFMRTQEERDEQTIRIAQVVFLVAMLAVALGLGVWAAQEVL